MIFYYLFGEGLEKKASDLLQKMTKLRTKSSGARMFVFSWECLARYVGFLQARGFAASIPRRGVFFREKPGPYFYVCKTLFLCDFFGVEPTPKK